MGFFVVPLDSPLLIVSNISFNFEMTSNDLFQELFPEIIIIFGEYTKPPQQKCIISRSLDLFSKYYCHVVALLQLFIFIFSGKKERFPRNIIIYIICSSYSFQSCYDNLCIPYSCPFTERDNMDIKFNLYKKCT